jgi:hypothetical protein
MTSAWLLLSRRGHPAPIPEVQHAPFGGRPPPLSHVTHGLARRSPKGTRHEGTDWGRLRSSAYNTTPDDFGEAWQRLCASLPGRDKDPEVFPNALATMWFHITDDAAEAERVMRERIVPTIHRPEEILRERVPVGPAEVLAAKLTDFARAGVQRVFVWPVADEVHQLERFWAEVRPLVLSGLDRSP